ncbi:hypothetical protein PA3_32470 [Acinetobacter pittii]|uniref:Uncharacterized protein n=1 Tax=Acinetobacter pittii TaxID=48296 RepID=A0A4Y3JAY7_ACIPI|nr:hypothetical protein [Acinetobacter pittii]GEA69089.1 hypothetical protein PA3_32470 [Acinetobacter pittii]
MTNTIQESSAHPIKYEVINKLPEKQLLTLQNTDAQNPIQLRVDPITDYTALTFTILTSIIVSGITAAVTILLIRMTNNKLAQSQANLQKQMLEHQAELKRNEVKAQNRQEWINKVRKLFVTYFNHSESFPMLLQRNFSVRHAYNRKVINYVEHNKMALEYQNYKSELRRLILEVDITLSATDTIDREISNLVHSFYEKFKSLTDLLEEELKSEYIHLDISITTKDIENKILSKEMNDINIEILNKIKILLKSEWEKVKRFD